MKVEYNYRNCILKLKFYFESSDKKEYDTHERKHVVKGRDTCVYYLPHGYDLKQLHPDRLALAIMLNIYSFIGKRLVLPFQTSSHFNNTVKQRLGIQIVNEPERGMSELPDKMRVRFSNIEETVERLPVETDEELAALEAEIQSNVSDDDLVKLEEFVRGSVMDSEDLVEDTVSEEDVDPVVEEEEGEGEPVVQEEEGEPVVEEEETEAVVEEDTELVVEEETETGVVAEPFEIETAKDKNPSLCLSMGVDSACGLSLMPKETVCVFLDRIFPMSGETIYKKDHVYHALQKVKNKGYTVYMVKTDMEYLRKRRGFVIDIGVGVPSILLSNHLNLRSIGYGYSIHNFTHYGDKRLLVNCTGDYCKFNHSKWNAVFKASGLFLNFITCGLTEIGTQKVVLQSPFKSMASGCMRGTITTPCQKCPKCYRKLLLEDLIRFKRIDDPRGHYQALSKSGEHKMGKIFGEFSSGLVMAYSYALRNYNGNDPFLRAVQNRLIKENNFNWKNKIKFIEKWFNGSNDRIDPLCMDYLKKRLGELGIPMVS